MSRHRVSAIAPHDPWLPIGRHSYRSHLATCNSQNLPLQSKSNRCNSRGCIHFLRSLLLSRSTILTGCRISTCPWTQHPDSTFNRVSSNPAFRALSSPIEPQADLEPELKPLCFFHVLARLAWGHHQMKSSRCLSCNTPNACSHSYHRFRGHGAVTDTCNSSNVYTPSFWTRTLDTVVLVRATIPIRDCPSVRNSRGRSQSQLDTICRVSSLCCIYIHTVGRGSFQISPVRTLLSNSCHHLVLNSKKPRGTL